MPFPTFPRGWAGIGLLLLRCVVGVTMLMHSLKAIGDPSSTIMVLCMAVFTMCAGAALIIGLFTPAAAALFGAGTVAAALGWIPWCPCNPVDLGTSTVFLISMYIAIALLGPGAISVDARRRGRREIVIPADTNRGNP